jgi:hypothetical protein
MNAQRIIECAILPRIFGWWLVKLKKSRYNSIIVFKTIHHQTGSVAERLNAPVLKTDEDVSPP